MRLSISSQTADFLFGWANFAAIAGGILVVLGTVGIFWFGNVREKFAEERLRATEQASHAAHERAAASTRAAEQLQSDLRIEQSARRQVEGRMAPRILPVDRQSMLAPAMKPFAAFPISIITYANDAEGAALAGQIIAGLPGYRVYDHRSGEMAIAGLVQGIQVAGGNRDMVDAFADVLRGSGLRVQVGDLPPPRFESSIVFDQPFRSRTSGVKVLVGAKP